MFDQLRRHPLTVILKGGDYPPERMLDREFLKGIGFGLVGGVVGTILMDIVMVATFLMVGEQWDTFFTMVGEKFGGGAVIGIALHNVVGLTGGFVFALAVLS
ncbi:hypothetical protein IMZ48_48580, partial [Candidatus Bathyarchaeota archaeon]|nr:hypothetical protein [Candidatus Bathyarchaeota archaeon]